MSPVSKPSFSCVSSSAAVVPPCLQRSTNAAASGLAAAIACAIGWSAATATKLAPKIVSGRVVNTSTLSMPPVLADSAKRKVRPWLLPIQFSCISRTFSGQCSSDFRPESRSSAKAVILRNHWLSLRFSTSAPDRQPRPSITCSLASTVMSTGSQLTALSLR